MSLSIQRHVASILEQAEMEKEIIAAIEEKLAAGNASSMNWLALRLKNHKSKKQALDDVAEIMQGWVGD